MIPIGGQLAERSRIAGDSRGQTWFLVFWMGRLGVDCQLNERRVAEAASDGDRAPGTRAGGLPLRGGIGETEAQASFSSQHGASTQRQSADVLSQRRGRILALRKRRSSGVVCAAVGNLRLCSQLHESLQAESPKGLPSSAV